MNERERKAAIRAAMQNPKPSVRNVLRPMAETVRATVIPPKPSVPQYEGLDDRDRSVRIFVTKEGEYYPGRMQQPTTWKCLRIEFEGEVINCWHGDSWGYEGDWTALDFECHDLENIEEWQERSEQCGPEFLTGEPRTRFFRHIADILAELKREGSVDIG